MNKSIVLVAIVAALAAPAVGQQLTVNNPGFEAQTIGLGGWTNNNITGWTAANSAGVQHMPSSAINPPAQDGVNHAYMNQNGVMYTIPQYQGSPVLVQANQTYKISLWVGRRAGNEGTFGGILTAFIQSSSGTTGIAEAIYDLQPNFPDTTGQQPRNSWVYKTLYLSTGPNPDGLGGQLQVGFQNTSSRAPASQFWYAQIEVDVVTMESIQPVAINPRPANNDLAYSTTPTLQWDAAIETAQHDVFLGESLADVNGATVSTAAIYKGRQGTRSFMTAPLIPGKTYYWRIDEVSGANTFKGEVWKFTVLGAAAYNPIPSDGATYIDPNVDLAWSPGVMAQSHDVYLGTSQSAVANATTASPEFKGNRIDPNYVLPTLDYDTIYYWRIDERNTDATITTGSVWSFRTVPFVPVTSPNLVGWWKLDDNQSKIVFDWSTRGNHGTYFGDPVWIAGMLDGGLAFTGYEYVECGSAASLNITGTITLATWVRANDAGNGENNPYVAKGNSSYALRQSTGNNIEFSIYDGAALQTVISPINSSFNGVWHHLAGTYDGTNLNLYVDGQPQATTPFAGAIATSTFGVNFARDAQQTWCWYNGALDDVRIYNQALTQAEIQQIMKGDPLRASTPHPLNGATVDIQQAVPLTWSPGQKALQHDVYLGTDRTTVESANTSTAGIYRGRQTAASYSPPETLQWGQVYYWRIDEFNNDSTTTKGGVWSFTVADYLIVDDFESYNDACGRIYYTWRDGLSFEANAACSVAAYNGNGTGSVVDPNRSFIHAGQQSMRLGYNNMPSPYYSQTLREWASPQDWTKYGVKALVVWFRGLATNTPASLYMIVEDSLGESKTLTLTDPNVVLRTAWQEWNIDLKDLSTAGLNLASIKRMTIGLDNRANIQTAGAGGSYVDDIRLYQPRCVASLLKPACDLNNDCIVDYRDLDLLAGDWLLADQVITTTSPGATGLAALYAMENNVQDTSGNNLNGTANGDPAFVAGATAGLGMALRFDGTDDYVDLPIGPVIAASTSMTVATWVNFPGQGGAWQRIFDFGTDTNVYMFLTPRMGTTGAMRFGITTSSTGGESQVTPPSTLAAGWYHVAVVIDGTAPATVRLYLDGLVVATGTTTILPRDLGQTTQNWLGRSQWTGDAFLVGSLDDFRIYTRALSAAEAAYLADPTPADGKLHVPVRSPAEFYSAEPDGSQKINFRDYAVLATSWLQEILWPQP